MNTQYDTIGRAVQQSLVAGGATQTVVQMSYDAANRRDCTAQRMNSAIFGSLPASACTMGTIGANGPDRIMRNLYDAANQITRVMTGVGTSAEQNESTTTFSSNGRMLTLADSNGNLTTFEYDGFDRLSRTRFPLASNGSQSSTTDYEQNTYDAASNVTQTRRRDGQTIGATFDTLNRMTDLNVPAGEDDISYAYDNFGRMASAAFSGHTLSFAFDALSRNVSQTSPLGAATYQYDLAGRRTRMIWPDSFFVTYDYDLTDAVTAIRENGAPSGIGVLATYAYDDLGRRTSVTRGNSATTSYGYDAASRLTSLAHDLAGTTNDQTFTFTYNAAFQALTRSGTNTAYTFAPAAPATTAYMCNDNFCVRSASIEMAG